MSNSQLGSPQHIGRTRLLVQWKASFSSPQQWHWTCKWLLWTTQPLTLKFCWWISAHVSVVLLRGPFSRLPSCDLQQAGRMSVPLCLGIWVASEMHDTSVFSPSCAWPRRKLTASSENGWLLCFLPPLPKARSHREQSWRGPWRHRGVRLSNISARTWHLISLPPSHHHEGRGPLWPPKYCLRLSPGHWIFTASPVHRRSPRLGVGTAQAQAALTFESGYEA